MQENYFPGWYLSNFRSVHALNYPREYLTIIELSLSGVLQQERFEKFCKIRRKISATESLFKNIFLRTNPSIEDVFL